MPQKVKYKAFLTAVAVIVIGIGYYLIVECTSFSIPCPFHKLTGLACPGCGITALCVKLIRLDFIGAVRENIGVTAVAVSFAVWYGIKALFCPKFMKKGSAFEKIFLVGCIIFLVVFGIVRNLDGMEFLLPSAMR